MSRIDEPNINSKRAVVGRSMPCRSCGYNLRGLRMDARCPECGLPVKTTIDEVIDPAQYQFPSISHPRHLGDALVWLSVCMLLCSVLLSLPSAVAALRDVEAWRGNRWLALGPREVLLAGAAAALFGLRGAWAIVISDRRSGEARLARFGRIVAAGLLILSVFGVASWAVEQSAHAAASSNARALAEPLWLRLGLATGGIIVVLAFGRILESIGQRSRMYREARGGKQSTRVMAVALLIVALGTLGQLAAMARDLPRVQSISRVLVASCALMLVVGSMYLVANSWWVRRSLRRPAPRLRDLVRVEPDTTRFPGSAMRPPGPGSKAGPM